RERAPLPRCPALPARRDVRQRRLEVDFRMDWDRERRTGVPEAVLCERKSPEQIAAIIAATRAENRRLFLTRLSAAAFAALAPDAAGLLDYDPLSATAILGASTEADEAAIDSPIGI